MQRELRGGISVSHQLCEYGKNLVQNEKVGNFPRYPDIREGKIRRRRGLLSTCDASLQTRKVGSRGKMIGSESGYRQWIPLVPFCGGSRLALGRNALIQTAKSRSCGQDAFLDASVFGLERLDQEDIFEGSVQSGAQGSTSRATL